MNILLIAYCFGVNRGSEPGVGWNVARGLALRGHHITVISTSKYYNENMAAIREESLDIELITKDFPDSRWTRSYKIWQAKIGPTIQRVANRFHYDIIHHITFNQYRGIRDVFYTRIPALIGPIGGAEVIPWPLLRYGSLPFIVRIKEIARHIPWDVLPLKWRLKKARHPISILCSNKITAERLSQGILQPKNYIGITPAIALHDAEIRNTRQIASPAPFILFDGGLSRPQKGTWLMLGALHELWKQNCRVPVRVVGLKPNEKNLMRKKARSLGLPDEALQLYEFIPRTEMMEYMSQAKVFLSTVFRDSGAMALLEALAQGTRIVCLDIPSQRWLKSNLVSKVKVQTSRIAMEKAIAESIQAQLEQPESDEEWENQRLSFLKNDMTWNSRIDQFEVIYNNLLNFHHGAGF